MAISLVVLYIYKYLRSSYGQLSVAPAEFEYDIDKSPLDARDNLANSGTWNIAGVTKTANGLKIVPAHTYIERRESGEYQLNPPFNSYGTHLNIPRCFSVTYTIKNLDDAHIYMYGAPPLIRDDSRHERRTISLRFATDTLTIRVETNDKPTIAATMKYKLTSKAVLRIDINGDNLGIVINQKVCGEILLPENFFMQQKLWFGFSVQDSLTLIETLHVTGSARITAVDTTALRVALSPLALQRLAAEKYPRMTIGAAVSPAPLTSNKAYFTRALSGNFGLFTTENILKPVHVMPIENQPVYGQIDAVINLAAAHNISIHGHALVFARSLPDWMRRLPTDTDADKQRVRAVMVRYITDVVTHFKGRIVSWDVVNEPLDDFSLQQPQLRQHLWYRAMGAEYIEIALRTARAADPDARLFINENAIEDDWHPAKKKRWRYLMNEVVIPLQQKGLLDGVGMQAHVYAIGRDRVRGSTVRRHLAELKQLELRGRISEMDVVPDKGERTQARQFREAFKACADSDNCDAFIVWGVSAGHGNRGVLWHEDGSETLAASNIRSLLR